MSGKKPAQKQIVLSKPVFEPPPSSAVQGKKKKEKKEGEKCFNVELLVGPHLVFDCAFCTFPPLKAKKRQKQNRGLPGTSRRSSSCVLTVPFEKKKFPSLTFFFLLEGH